MASSTAPSTATIARTSRIMRWFLAFTAASQLLDLSLGAAHRCPAPPRETDGGEQGQRISRDDERPGVHAAAIRFSRASILLRARSPRIRISTIAPNSSEKPSADASSGQSIEPLIVELPRRKLMLSP